MKESDRQKKSFSSQERKDEMLISCGEHSTADGCFIMPVLQTKTSCYSLLVTKGFGGQITFNFESKNLNGFSFPLTKKTFMICQQIEHDNGLCCMISTDIQLNE